MKAKSKVLLGLLVALAMMVFAVPAFADVVFTVSDPTPDSVVVMRRTSTTDQKTVKLTITEATSKATDVYTITPTVDGTAGTTGTATVATAGTPVEYTYTTPANLAVGNHTITFSVEKTTAVDADTKGTKAPAKALTVKVINAFTATLNGATSPSGSVTDYTKDVVKGQDSGLSAYSDASSATYQWQSSSKVDEADDAKSTKWTNISGKTSAQLGTVDDLDGKYVRCLITNDGETVVAINSAAKDESTKTALMYAVKLAVNDTAKITLDETKMVDATYFVGETIPSANDLGVTASGGSGTYTYKWIVDGEKNEASGQPATKKPSATEAGTQTYAVEVTDTTSPKALTTTSKTVTITWIDTPVVKMENASNETPAKYRTGLHADAGSGDIVVAAADKDKDLVLKPVIENAEGKIRSIIWNDVDPGETYTVKAADIKTGTTEIVKVNFNGITEPLTYTVTLKVSSGTLTGTNGGIFTQVDSSVSKRPDYTITLPEGTEWGDYIKNLQAGDEISVNSATGSTPDGAFTINTPSNLTPKLKTKVANGSDPLVFYLDGESDEANPYVKDMTLTINPSYKVTDASTGAETTKTVLVDTDGDASTNPEAVILPVSKNVGYSITKTPATGSVQLTAPKKESVVGTADYTGSPITATVEPASGYDGLGEISNIRYEKYDPSGTPPTTPGPTATTTAPTDAGTYKVFCDIAASEKYAAANNVAVSRPLTIAKVTLSATNADKYLEMDPETVVYDGQNKGTTVTFKDDITKAGKVDKITYYVENADTTTASPVVPVKVGKYDVYVTTTATATPAASDEFDNIGKVDTAPGVKVGVFEITKTQPTEDLYKIDPDEVKYDGEEHTANVVKTDDKAGDVEKVHYFAEGSDKELTGKPTEAGVYTVKIDTKESDTYAAVSGEDALEIGTFTIKDAKSDQPEIWMIGHVQDVDWGDKGSGKAVKLEAGKTAQVGTTGLGKRVEAITILVPEDYTVEGFAHIQDKDDVEVVEDKNPTYIKNMDEIPEGYKAYKFGTTGEAKRIEAINIAIKDADGKYVEGLEYATHVQNMGWLGTVRNGSFSGSRGLALRMEAVRFYYDDQIRRPTDIDKETK